MVTRRQREDRRRLGSASGMLGVLSPLATLKRGFTMTLDAEGRLVRHRADVASGDTLVTRFADGEVIVRVAG